jgi:hypothetical protein
MTPAANRRFHFDRIRRSFRALTSCEIESKKSNATAADINRDERDRVIFVQPALFAPAFVSFRHVTDWLQHTPSKRGSSFIFMREQRRAHFVAACLRADEMQKTPSRTGRANICSVTIAPLRRANSPRACPVTDLFCCSS